MATEVTMPKLGLTMTEGLLARWLVEDGAPVRKGQPLFEVETDKATVEAEARADGLLRVVAAAGSTVAVTGLVGYILQPSEALPGAPLPFPKASAPSPAGQAIVHQAASPNGRKLSSPAAKRRARELGVDVDQVPGTGENGRVDVADVEAFAAARARQAPTESPETEAPRASPLVRRLAEEAGVDLGQVQGTGPGGRVTREDVEQVAASSRLSVPAVACPDEGELVPIRGIRAITAERMLASSHQTAAVTLVTEADATELVSMRSQINESLGEKLGLRIAYDDVLVKVVARALREHPYMNARQEGDAIRLLKGVHVGVAVDTERGLLVPVVRDADRKSIQQISRDLRGKVERAVAGKSLPDELTGGTFTITNLGMFDVDAFTPIVNPPELAILGIGRIARKPVAYQEGVALRYRVTLSLTFDHRLADGAPAARFLKRVKDLIEKPYALFVEDAG